MQKEGEIYRCRNAWHVHVLLMGRLRHSVNTVNTAVQCPAQTDRVCGDHWKRLREAFPLETAAGGIPIGNGCGRPGVGARSPPCTVVRECAAVRVALVRADQRDLPGNVTDVWASYGRVTDV